MVLSFRTMIVAVGVFGVGLGIAFGVGVAYGKGDSQTVNTGLTQQQVLSLLSGGGLQGSGTGAGGAQASGTPGAGGSSGGLGSLFGNNTMGQITAINGQTLTVQGLQGSVKVTLPAAAKVNTYKSGSASDLKVGDSVIVVGTRKDDGSVEATSLSQLPAELQGLGTGAGGGRPPTSATATP